MWQPQELVGNKSVITRIQPPDTAGELLIFTLSNVSEIIRKITSSTQSWSENIAAHFLTQSYSCSGDGDGIWLQ